MADDVQWDRSLFGNLYNPDNWISSEASLTRRGLITRKTASELCDGGNAMGGQGPLPSCCKLTPAGIAVVELLKVSGLFVEADGAVMKKARKA